MIKIRELKLMDQTRENHAIANNKTMMDHVSDYMHYHKLTK